MRDKKSSTVPPEYDIPYLRAKTHTVENPNKACLGCGKTLPSSTGISDAESPPEPGSISICWECGHIQAFDDPPISYRPLTDEEMVDLAGHPIITSAAELRGVMMDRKRLKDEGKLDDIAEFFLGERARAAARKMKTATDEWEGQK